MVTQINYSSSCPIVKPPDRIDLTNSNAFKDALQSVYNEGHIIVEIDFSDLYFIDSAGLAQLIVFQKKFKDKGGELKIINMNHSYIKRLFKRIELHTVINIEGLSDAPEPGAASSH